MSELTKNDIEQWRGALRMEFSNSVETDALCNMALAHLSEKEGREGAKGIAKRMADELARLMATAIDPQDFHEINLLLDEYRASLTPREQKQ